MRGNALMAGTLIAFTANGAADGDHGECGKAYPIGTQQDHFEYICTGFYTAVAPDFHTVANAGFHQGAMCLHYTNFYR